jgi:hypothetical protein
MIFDEGAGLSTEKQQYDPTPVINELRHHVDQWRNWPNPNEWMVTPETARLLQHWRRVSPGPCETLREMWLLSRENCAENMYQTQNQQGGFPYDGQQRPQEPIPKHRTIQKSRIVFAGPRSVTHMGGNTLQVICSGTLKANRKSSGVASKRFLPKIPGWELVEREIAAHRRERVRV